MIEQLFGSKTRIKLLGLFYQNPDRSFYVREITRKIDEQINSVRRELANLLSIGIISSDSSGNTNNKLYYQVNKDFEHADALASMFGGKPLPKKKATKAKKSDNVDVDVNEAPEVPVDIEHSDEHINNISRAGNVRMLMYTGQFTREDDLGVDVVIIGDMNLPNLEHAIQKLEEAEMKQISFSVFTPIEYEYRRQINDRFVSNLLLARKIVHIDKDKLLG